MAKENSRKKSFSPQEIREAFGMTQDQMALLCAVDRSHYAHWEKGRKKMPEGVKNLMVDLMKWLDEKTPEEKEGLRATHRENEEKWRTYYLGRLYQLTEELDRLRERRDKTVRLYQLRTQMAAKIRAASRHPGKLPVHLTVFCNLAERSLKKHIGSDHLEEIHRMELSVATLQFQIRQLRQWVKVPGTGEKKLARNFQHGSAEKTVSS